MNDKNASSTPLPRSVAEWLADAVADADRRGLPELKDLLEGLAQSTAALRAAGWDSQGAEGEPGAEGAER